MLNKAFSYIF